MTGWTEHDIADQTGRTALVTGANTGIGFETARALAAHGARVLLACRDEARADAAVQRIRSVAPKCDIEVVVLDLASLRSVRSTVASVTELTERLDLLVNNAGVMAIPKRSTDDGFEMQFGTNHLGHFALTGLLLDLLVATEGSRVVTVSSLAHRMGRIDFDDLAAEHGYHRWPRYAMSKVANLLFTYELDRRLRRSQSSTVAVAAHPGGTNTELARDAGTLAKLTMPLIRWTMQSAGRAAHAAGCHRPNRAGRRVLRPGRYRRDSRPARTRRQLAPQQAGRHRTAAVVAVRAPHGCVLPRRPVTRPPRPARLAW
jgi:NAD(P)-dependent dehydrogenase (short-subunit alcohol dehydrogenase family)